MNFFKHHNLPFECAIFIIKACLIRENFHFIPKNISSLSLFLSRIIKEAKIDSRGSRRRRANIFIFSVFFLFLEIAHKKKRIEDEIYGKYEIAQQQREGEMIWRH